MKLNSQFTPNTPGVFIGVPMGAYQAAPGLSKSRIDTLIRSPLDYIRAERAGYVREPTDAMELSTAFHDLLLEDRREYVVRPDTYEAPESAKKDAPLIVKPWNGNANTCKAWLASHAGKTVLTRDEVSELDGGVSYIKAHPLAAPILRKPGVAELSLFAQHPRLGYLLKGRADWLWVNEDGTVSIADLKAVKDASTREFAKDIFHRGYHRQAAQYRLILEALGLTLREWLFIIFEKGDAPKCNVRRLKVEAIDKGAEELESAFGLYTLCKSFDSWPDFADSTAAVEEIDLPSYAYGAVEDLEGMTPATLED